MTNAEFTTAYLDAMGWKDSVVADENLSVEYPACVYTFSDRRVTALVPEAMCLREEIPEGAALTEVLGVLVDLEAVRAKGLGTRVAAALIRKVQEQGFIALDRVE